LNVRPRWPCDNERPHTDPAGQAILAGELNGSDDVDDKTGEQERADGPEHRPEAMQKRAIHVDARFVWQEDLQVPGQVTEHVGDEDEACESDDPFFAD